MTIMILMGVQDQQVGEYQLFACLYEHFLTFRGQSNSEEK